MPWIKKGNSIYKRTANGLIKKQTTSSPENAQKALNLLRGIEHGWTPTRFNKKMLPAKLEPLKALKSK